MRVIEEYFRFMENNPELSIELKGLRHNLIGIEKKLGRNNLISNRDTATDCFSKETRPEELTRECVEDIVYAGFKRAQEASRVIEEYSKIAGSPDASAIAKSVRFSLYTIEKTLWKTLNNE
jgi:thiamine-phosphate pyrophosphorylase